MNDNEYLASIVVGLLEQGRSAVLATIIDQTGSSPRHIGTKMVVDDQGKIYGTIGGSLIEAAGIKESWAIHTKKASMIMEFDLDHADVHSSGMICGGKARVMLDYISPTEENLTFTRNWYNSLNHGHGLALMTIFKQTDHTISETFHCLLLADGQVMGPCPLSEPEVDRLASQLRSNPVTSVVSLGQRQVLLNPFQRLKTLYCFGAGHVAKPTALLASLVGFRVVVLDDRLEFANKERFPDAWEVRVIDSFIDVVKDLAIDSDSYIVILTRGHLYDREVLEQSLKTGAGYIGMISSRTKRDAIYAALMETGVTQDDLARVCSPIGLSIGAETPEEIAVAIVAELIQHRAKQQKDESR